MTNYSMVLIGGYTSLYGILLYSLNLAERHQKYPKISYVVNSKPIYSDKKCPVTKRLFKGYNY